MKAKAIAVKATLVGAAATVLVAAAEPQLDMYEAISIAEQQAHRHEEGMASPPVQHEEPRKVPMNAQVYTIPASASATMATGTMTLSTVSIDGFLRMPDTILEQEYRGPLPEYTPAIWIRS